MANTTPDSIYYATTADPEALDTVSASMATSIQAALLQRQGSDFIWANAAARTAQTGMAIDNLGYQQDTNVTYRYNGSGWILWIQHPTAFTPTITTAFSVGSGTTVGHWARTGNSTMATIGLVLGTGFSIADLQLTMPDALSTGDGPMTFGSVTLRHGSAYFDGFLRYINATTFQVLAKTVASTFITGTALTSTTPFTWAVGDQVLINYNVMGNG